MESHKCTKKKCKYPISCEYNNMCMDYEMKKVFLQRKSKKPQLKSWGYFVS